MAYRFAVFLTLLFVFVTLPYSNAHGLCGVAQRSGCWGGCFVKGWDNECDPKCTSKSVQCGTPITYRAWRSVKPCHCSASVAKCYKRCKPVMRYQCDWDRPVRREDGSKFRDLQDTHQQAGKDAASKIRDALAKHYDTNKVQPVNRFYTNPHRWSGKECRQYRFTYCSCNFNPCKCAAEDTHKPTPSASPVVNRDPPRASTPSPSPTQSPIFTDVLASPVSRVLDW